MPGSVFQFFDLAGFSFFRVYAGKQTVRTADVGIGGYGKFQNLLCLLDISGLL